MLSDDCTVKKSHLATQKASTDRGPVHSLQHLEKLTIRALLVWPTDGLNLGFRAHDRHPCKSSVKGKHDSPGRAEEAPQRCYKERNSAPKLIQRIAGAGIGAFFAYWGEA
jgi:hypothetical protein